MTLVLEIEYLAGTCFAARGPEDTLPDWPPQPDRVFSALVATWAARGNEDAEAKALEWLEALPPPRIKASDASPRSAPVVYVPPNDPRLDRQKHAQGVFPRLRTRQPRHFPAATPTEPVVRYFWLEAEPARDILMSLQQLAHDTAYVGHSASLTRCHFFTTPAIPTDTRIPHRRVYHGRLAELCRNFDAGLRPLPGAWVRDTSENSGQDMPHSTFGREWLLLEHVGGAIPDLRASSLVAKTIRDALLSGYRRAGLGDRIPEIISGHEPDGRPARRPHLAIVPLPFVGFPHADGHVMGFALIGPRDIDLWGDEGFRSALRVLAPYKEGSSRRILTVKSPLKTPMDKAFALEFSLTGEMPLGKRSMNPWIYLRPGSTFATATPIVLDRHLKDRGEARQTEIIEQIARACQNIGLPEPARIVPDRHSALEGSPPAFPAGREPAWMRWRLPEALASRPLVHATIRFSQPVEGPVLLGAGRHLGLGLCQPIDGEA